MRRGFITMTLMAIGFALATATVLPADEGEKADGRKRCGPGALAGTWGVISEGEVVGVGRLASVALEVFDDQGNFFGDATTSLAGQVGQFHVTGTYVVNPDCTGTMEATFDNGFSGTLSFVLVDGGKRMFVIETDPGTVVWGTYERR
jgi:hypothetical protein